MGRQGARAFVLLATAAIGNTAGLSTKGPGPPGYSQAVVLAETQGGFRLAALNEVRSVAVSAEGAFTIALAPNAVAMTAQGGNPSTRLIPITESRARHIFRNEPGHLSDTPENRQLLQDLAADESARLGTDRFGNVWSARLNPDGTQTWVQVRHGEIINGGLNQLPRNFDPRTGLSAPTRPGG